MTTLRKTLVTVLAAAASLALAEPASASRGTAALKQVQVPDGSRIELVFDGKVGKGQVRTEYFNDVIQLSLNDVTVYPAKISSINSGNLVKVFAYQYAPKLVRCRITVKGKAESFKDRLRVIASGKTLAIRFSETDAKADSLTLGAAAATRARPGSAGDQSPAAQSAGTKSQGGAPGETIEINDAEERALLERVISGTKSAGETAAAPQGKAAEKQEKSDKQEKSEKQERKSAGARPLPSFAGVFLKLAGVLALFGAIAFAVRKLGFGSGNRKGVLGAINRFARSSFGKSDKMIEVLSTHYLGPKKSIAVVRVLGRVLVLGVTNDSVNLITQLSGEGDGLDMGVLGETLGIERAPSASESAPSGALERAPSGATAAGPAAFADLLMSERNKPVMAPNPQLAKPAMSPPTAQNSAVRAQIRSRLEGLKPL